MTAHPLASRVSVCSWSLRPSSPDALIADLDQIGIQRTQLALKPLLEEPAVWGDAAARFADAGVSIASGMLETIGEDYTTLKSIKRTGGVVPDETWEGNWENFQKLAVIAQDIGVRFANFHAGFLPHDPADPDFEKLLGRVRQIADLFAGADVELGLETGQETAETLDAFLRVLDRPSVGVNFDPANMILYDKGDPVSALSELMPWVKHIHIKDANRTTTPGAWGEEVVVGRGQVDWSGFRRVLDEAGYQGDFAIEREADDQRVEDIRAARAFLEETF